MYEYVCFFVCVWFVSLWLSEVRVDRFHDYSSNPPCLIDFYDKCFGVCLVLVILAC